VEKTLAIRQGEYEKGADEDLSDGMCAQGEGENHELVEMKGRGIRRKKCILLLKKRQRAQKFTQGPQ